MNDQLPNPNPLNIIFPVQVISLVRRTDRREQFAQHAKEMGFAYVFRDAIEGQRGAMRDITTSHKNVVHWAKQHGLPEVTIMEDDCYFPDPRGWQWYQHNRPTDAHDLYLGGIYSGKPDATGRVEKFCATHCYTLQARFYDRFLSMPLDQYIDHAISSLGGDYRVCMPYAAIQRTGHSDQKGKVVDYSSHVEGRFFDGTSTKVDPERWARWTADQERE